MTPREVWPGAPQALLDLVEARALLLCALRSYHGAVDRLDSAAKGLSAPDRLARLIAATEAERARLALHQRIDLVVQGIRLLLSRKAAYEAWRTARSLTDH